MTKSQFIDLAFLAGLVACLLGASSQAEGDAYQRFPGAPTDRRTQRIQEHVEELYSNQDYERALLIYEKQLAPVGDKYAQYMVGYMTLTGRGRSENAPLALAWYGLAAERNGNPYVRARDALEQSLDADEVREGHAGFIDLQQRFGDRRLLLNLLRDDLEALSRFDRLPPDGDLSRSTLSSGFLNASARIDTYRSIRERMQARLDYLEAMPRAAGDVAASMDLQQFEESVRAELASLPVITP